MFFNPTKCVVVRITKKRNPLKANYNIQNHDIEFIRNGKYFGVTLSDNIFWNVHVDDITKKAYNTAFPHRNLARCQRDIKAHCYTSLVRLVMDMCQLPGIPTLLQISSNLKESSEEQPGSLPGSIRQQTVQAR